MDLITTAEFAEMARTSPETVRYWRHMGTGPDGFRVGRKVLYERGACEQWLRDLRDKQTGRADHLAAGPGNGGRAA